MALDLPDLSQATPAEICTAIRRLIGELRHHTRGPVARTWNLPTGDYAEYLIWKHFGGTLLPNSNKGQDIAVDGKRIQVKSRVVSIPPTPGEGDLSAIRSWTFTHLAVVMFEAGDFLVREARIVPRVVAEEWRRRADHTNADTVSITKPRLKDARCENITGQLQATAASIGGRR